MALQHSKLTSPHLTSPPGRCCSRPSNQFTINGCLYSNPIHYYNNLPTTNRYFRIFNFNFFAFRAPVSSLALHLEHIINYLLKITSGGAIFLYVKLLLISKQFLRSKMNTLSSFLSHPLSNTLSSGPSEHSDNTEADAPFVTVPSTKIEKRSSRIQMSVLISVINQLNAQIIVL